MSKSFQGVKEMRLLFCSILTFTALMSSYVYAGTQAFKMIPEDLAGRNLDVDAWQLVLEHSQHSNQELLELSQQLSSIGIAAKNVIVERLRSWIGPDEALRLQYGQAYNERLHRRIYLKHFQAIHDVWRDMEPVVIHYNPANSELIRDAKIAAFDPHNPQRIAISNGTANSRTISLVDLTTGHRQVIYSRDNSPWGSHPQVIFAKWQANLLYINNRRSIFAIDLNQTNPRPMPVLNEPLILDMHIDHEAKNLIFRDWSENVHVVSLEGGRPPFMLPHVRASRMVTDISDGSELLTFSQLAVKLWDRKTFELKLTIDLSAISDRSYKVPFTNPSKPHILTVLSNSGRVAKFDLRNGELLAEGMTCENNRIGSTIVSDTNRLVISCNNGDLLFTDLDTFEVIGSSQNVILDRALALKEPSPYLISWETGGNKINVFDKKTGNHKGSIDKSCNLGWLPWICYHVGLNSAENFTFKHVAVSPWDSSRIVSSNGQDLVVWDLEKKTSKTSSPKNVVVSDIQTFMIHPYNPNLILLLSESGQLVIWDFWSKAKERLRTNEVIHPAF